MTNEAEKPASLFPEFEPVSRQQWDERVKKDLKDTDPETLTWHTYEGIDVNPYYTREDLPENNFTKALPGNFPFIRTPKTTANKWLNVQHVKVNKDTIAGVQKAVDALKKGADSINFSILHPESFDFEYLVQHIDLTQTPVSYKLRQSPQDFLEKLFQTLHQQEISPLNLKGFINIAPSISGDLYDQLHLRQLEKIIELTRDSPDFYGITVNGSYFSNRGVTTVQEIALTLSLATLYLDKLTDTGISPEAVMRNMQFHLTAGTNYFFEIAKFRAIRLLWASVVKAYQTEPNLAGKLRLHVTTSRWHQTTFDPYINLLRSTTEALSAIIGGCDSLVVEPFDSTYKTPDEFSERIARNIPVILKEESYMDKAVDAAAGSYYLENLTLELAENAWKLFQELEGEGGFLKAATSSTIEAMLKDTSEAKFKNIASGKDVIVGTNKYPNSLEKLDFDPEELMQNKSFDTTRASYPFEVMRLAAERHLRKRNQKPQAIVASIGPAIQRFINATFAKEFFACSGFETEILHFETVKDAVNYLNEVSAEVLVMSASDEEFTNFALQFGPELKAHKDQPALILAANPQHMKDELKAHGFDEFLFQGCDTQSIIARIQHKLGNDE